MLFSICKMILPYLNIFETLTLTNYNYQLEHVWFLIAGHRPADMQLVHSSLSDWHLQYSADVFQTPY